MLWGRALGILPEGVEDAILDAMDPLWYAMSDSERAMIDAEANEVPIAPERLGLVDVGLGQWPPRRAA